ncbi:MAG: hypothetical protein LBT45_03220 [Rickettsiales bacterium]|nr:hypothetical protein [Rickettsiales bacterium]
MAFFIIPFLLLSACIAPGSKIAKNNLELAVMKGGGPAAGYEVEVKLPKWYGQGRFDSDFGSKDFISNKFKTDTGGKIKIPVDAVHHVDFLFIGFPFAITEIRKPMLFIESEDIRDCNLILWYLEDKDFFVPLNYKNEEINPLKYPDDVTGSFNKTDDGWDIKAVIRRVDRICEAREAAE